MIQDVDQRTGGDAAARHRHALHRDRPAGRARSDRRHRPRRRSAALLPAAAARPRRAEGGDAPARSARASRACPRRAAISGSGRREAIMTGRLALRAAGRRGCPSRAVSGSCHREVRRAYGAEMIATFEAAANEPGVPDRWPSAGCCSTRSSISRWSRRANRAGGRRSAAPASRPDRISAASGSSVGVAAGVAIAGETAGVLRRGGADAGLRRRHHHGRVLARGHGADQAAAVSGRGRAGHRLRAQSLGA